MRGVKQLFPTLCALGLLLAACREKGEPFLGITELCPRRAQEICAARAEPCCADGSASENCVKEETDACEAARKRIAKETELEYQSQYAASVASEQSDALFNCEAPFPVERYFKHTRAEGEACERGTQCESGQCGAESEVCESAEEASLCPAE